MGLGDPDYLPTSNPREILGLEKREEHRSGGHPLPAFALRQIFSERNREAELKNTQGRKSYLTPIASDCQPIAQGERGGPAQVEQHYYAFSFSGFFFASFLPV